MSEKVYRIPRPKWHEADRDANKITYRADTLIGPLVVEHWTERGDFICWIKQRTEPGTICKSVAHGQEICERWYVERMASGLEEVTPSANEQAMFELEKWNRKYRRFRIASSGSVQPGDGVYVRLEGEGRTVDLLEDEMFLKEVNGDDRDYEPTMAEVILEALRKWNERTVSYE